MYVRKKKNRSGVISIQVLAKIHGKSKLIKTIGSSPDPLEVEHLLVKAREYVDNYGGQYSLNLSDDASILKSSFNRISSHDEIGTDLLLGQLFEEIGFSRVKDDLFKKLVLARVSFPSSKRKTSDYLHRYKSLNIPVQQLYRYLDKLHSSQKELVQDISYQHTLRILGSQINVIFYDVTTLYFEIDNEDELRKTGFSKEGKHQNPQIVLGLLVSKNAYPLAYDIFEGNKFEGHTMLPVIDNFKRKYKLDKLVIIADSGLLSNTNIKELELRGYEFILGARIKNEEHKTKEKILGLELKNGESSVIKKNGLKLIVSYSEDRAKKDRYNREKGLGKLEKRLKSGKLNKSSINNRGYNKYLRLEGEMMVSIDYEKYKADNRWDGLKGYITNTTLTKHQVIENYQHLWQIEKAFKITKSDLKIRPIYHRLQRRIEAHICIAFVAYKIYKELERQLKLKKVNMSAERAIEIAKSIYQIKATTDSGHELKHILLINPEQKTLAQLFGFG